MQASVDDVSEAAVEPVLPTRLDALLAWSRKHALAPYPFVAGCCSTEVEALRGPRMDPRAIGLEAPRYSPRQADLLLVAGTITQRQAPVLKKVYDQMAEPKWVVAFGACAISGGPYDNYAVVQGIDALIPVDLYIPGCPPAPDVVVDALGRLRERIAREPVPRAGRHREMDALDPSAPASVGSTDSTDSADSTGSAD